MHVHNQNINENIFEIGNSYPLNISIMNRGLGESNGNVTVNILSSSNLIFGPNNPMHHAYFHQLFEL